MGRDIALVIRDVLARRDDGRHGQLWRGLRPVPAHAAFGRLRDEQGKPDEARAAYAAACRVIDGMRARLTTPELNAALDRAAFVKRLAELSASR